MKSFRFKLQAETKIPKVEKEDVSQTPDVSVTPKPLTFDELAAKYPLLEMSEEAYEAFRKYSKDMSWNNIFNYGDEDSWKYREKTLQRREIGQDNKKIINSGVKESNNF